MSQALQKPVTTSRVASGLRTDRSHSTRSVAAVGRKANETRSLSLPVRCTANSDVSTTEKKKARKKSPLETGGTVEGDKRFGLDAGAGARGVPTMEKFEDPRWVKGRWDYAQFTGKDGEVDWDRVIDAEIRRRRILEDNPEACVIDDEVVFDTAEIPWQAWVKRFHLPAAEQVNGRAAMIGFAAAWGIDAVAHVSIADQMGSFWGKCFMGVTFLGCMVVRRLEDLENLQVLSEEATFYDKQWTATWDGVERPSETEN